MTLCSLFGHVRHDPRRYALVHWFTTDGMGVKHAEVNYRCDRCDSMVLLTRIHLPKEPQLAKLSGGAA